MKMNDLKRIIEHLLYEEFMACLFCINNLSQYRAKIQISW